MTRHDLETIIEQALVLLENGKSPREIFEILPKYKKELAKIFPVLDLIAEEKTKIAPPKELLATIIANLPSAQAVTEKANGRYSYRGEQESREPKGRPSKIFITKTQIRDLMTINWKTWAPLGIIAVVALALAGFYRSSTQIPQGSGTNGKQLAITALATGSVDDVTNAILAELADDQAQFTEAAADAELINTDSQAISDFGQSYNETQF